MLPHVAWASSDVHGAHMYHSAEHALGLLPPMLCDVLLAYHSGSGMRTLWHVASACSDAHGAEHALGFPACACKCSVVSCRIDWGPVTLHEGAGCWF
jgi:hypothetical protein